MNYEVKVSSRFKRLNKKYHSLVDDFQIFVATLKQNPDSGADLGHGTRKVRMSIASKGKGKSHGARGITHTAIIRVNEGIITLLTIYDKNEQENISSKEITEIIKEEKIAKSFQ